MQIFTHRTAALEMNIETKHGSLSTLIYRLKWPKEELQFLAIYCLFFFFFFTSLDVLLKIKKNKKQGKK